MYCTNCGEPMNDGAQVCVKCGYAKNTAKNFCANCGQPVDPNAAICVKCGAPLKKVSAGGNLNGQDKMVMAIVAFFLGGLGIHNFMMGETKKGIFRIVMSCLCGIGAILALIDFIKILTDKYEVNPDALI